MAIKIGETEKTIPDHNHDEYITTEEFKNLNKTVNASKTKHFTG